MVAEHTESQILINADYVQMLPFDFMISIVETGISAEHKRYSRPTSAKALLQTTSHVLPENKVPTFICKRNKLIKYVCL